MKKIDTRTMTITGIKLPMCSRCTSVRARCVQFLARTAHLDGTVNHNRGSARNVRLCRACLADMLAFFA